MRDIAEKEVLWRNMNSSERFCWAAKDFWSSANYFSRLPYTSATILVAATEIGLRSCTINETNILRSACLWRCGVRTQVETRQSRVISLATACPAVIFRTICAIVRPYPLRIFSLPASRGTVLTSAVYCAPHECSNDYAKALRYLRGQ